jgi:tRNA(adenine34) deaminase
MTTTSYSIEFMDLALQCANEAFLNNEVPVGAVVVKNGEVIGKGSNTVLKDNSIASHAEINAIIAASKFIKNYRLVGCDLYTTLEPCHMCAKAIVDARIKSLYFGAQEPKTGAVESIDTFLNRKDINHQVFFSGGHLKDECAELLKNFFKYRRD